MPHPSPATFAGIFRPSSTPLCYNPIRIGPRIHTLSVIYKLRTTSNYQFLYTKLLSDATSCNTETVPKYTYTRNPLFNFICESSPHERVAGDPLPDRMPVTFTRAAFSPLIGAFLTAKPYSAVLRGLFVSASDCCVRLALFTVIHAICMVYSNTHTAEPEYGSKKCPHDKHIYTHGAVVPHIHHLIVHGQNIQPRHLTRTPTG